jgi:tRNA(Ile2)-agmatinylcytidine synthase
MAQMIEMHIGFDDTDSLRMGCTTYIAAIIIEELDELNVSFIDYPNLIRLNPNVPWKTRGNGALCLRIECCEHKIEDVKETVVSIIETRADLNCKKTEPGIVFLYGDLPREIKDFSKRTIQKVVEKKDALKLIKKMDCEAIGFKNNRGLIGGLAAIGERLLGDHTFEIITYRTLSTVLEMDKRTAPFTYNNVDPDTGRILITPRGADPILYGIRGENPEIVMDAHNIVQSNEPIERWTIFRTNQGTDAHLQEVCPINKLMPISSAIAEGFVLQKPKVIPGGHVIFSIQDNTGRVDCAAYEPTGLIKTTARKLVEGDLIRVYGGVRQNSMNPFTINLEKMEVLKLAPKASFINPACNSCGKRMKSMGTEKGFRCKKCGFRSLRIEKEIVRLKRDLCKGLYISSPRAQRHLTKPICRYGIEKREKKEKKEKKRMSTQQFFCIVS